MQIVIVHTYSLLRDRNASCTIRQEQVPERTKQMQQPGQNVSDRSPVGSLPHQAQQELHSTRGGVAGADRRHFIAPCIRLATADSMHRVTKCLLAKGPTHTQPVKKFPVFCGNRRLLGCRLHTHLSSTSRGNDFQLTSRFCCWVGYGAEEKSPQSGIDPRS